MKVPLVCMACDDGDPARGHSYGCGNVYQRLNRFKQVFEQLEFGNA